MTESNPHAPCGPCRDEPDALSPCPCHHSPCLHDRNKTIADLHKKVAELREEIGEQVRRDHSMMKDMRDDTERLRQERNATIEKQNALLEAQGGMIANLREQIATLRVVPIEAPGQTVCVDPDCPYPEHEDDCPSPNTEQWEHMAKLRARQISVLHRWLHERDEVITQQNKILSAEKKILSAEKKKYEYDVYALSNCERTPVKVGFAKDVGDDEGQVQIRDSIFVHLDALPVSGKLSIRKRREAPP